METTFVAQMDNVWLSVDGGQTSIFILLNLCAEFDTVDHEILLSHLREVAGAKGNALNSLNSSRGVNLKREKAPLPHSSYLSFNHI